MFFGGQSIVTRSCLLKMLLTRSPIADGYWREALAIDSWGVETKA